MKVTLLAKFMDYTYLAGGQQQREIAYDILKSWDLEIRFTDFGRFIEIYEDLKYLLRFLMIHMQLNTQ